MAAAWEIALCVGLTAVGLAISWLTWRRHGPRRAARIAAWSLLPLAAYLTGAIPMIGRVISAISRFAGSFVFSPRSWAGLILVGVAIVIFLASGGLPVHRGRKERRRRRTEQAQANAGKHGQPQAGPGERAPAVTGGRSAQAARDAGQMGAGRGGSAELAEAEEILRRRGIK